MELSFIIVTAGKRPYQTSMLLKSIEVARAHYSNQLNYEIILVGRPEPLYELNKKILPIKCLKCADNGYIGFGRNMGAKYAKYENLIFLDDDVLLNPIWIKRLEEYSAEKKWNVCSNKILTPAGGRYFDRATFCPHELVVYDCPPNCPNLYISGPCFLIKRDVWKQHGWRNTLKIWEYTKGKIYFSEDVEYSERLLSYGYNLDFDKDNTVWHWDYQYVQNGNHTHKMFLNEVPPFECKEFKQLLKVLHLWDAT